MSVAERRDVVVQNKNKGSGRGRKHEVIISESAKCIDSLKLQGDKPFMTKKQRLGQSVISFRIPLLGLLQS